LKPVIHDPNPRRTPWGWIILGFGVAGLLFGLLIVAVAWRASRVGWPDLTPDSSSHIKEKDDPYTPDCAIIRKWLAANEGDVEVTHWGNRTIHQSAAFGGSVHLSATWHIKGQRWTKHGYFTIGPWDNVDSVTIDD
jgi:hypothetical protein